MVNIQDNDGYKMLSLVDTNKVTVVNAGELKGVVVDQLASSSVCLNLAGIKYIDSTGISVLISGIKVSRESGNKFFISGVEPEVSKLLTLMKIDKIIEIV